MQTTVVSPGVLGLLCALGLYVSYLASGSFIEFIMWSVRKSHSDDDILQVPDVEQAKLKYCDYLSEPI